MELLVVVVVIGVLASLSMSGLLVARSSARRAKTVSTIRKLHEAVLPFYEEYESRRPMLPNVTPLLQLDTGRSHVNDLRQWALRRLMTLELPERLEDVTDAIPPGSSQYPQTKNYNGKLLSTGATTTVSMSLSEIPPVTRRYGALLNGRASNQVDSAELLHLIVTRGPVADPDIVAHFRDDEIGDTDGDGLREFIDGWGQGIAFRRWPIGFNSAAQPIDGTRRTIDNAVSPNGHRLVPLIFSAGPDKAFDIETAYDSVKNEGLHYAAATFQYDPFSQASNTVRLPGSPNVAGEVVLVPVTRGSSGPLTFVAVRASSGLSVVAPPVEAGATAAVSAAFFTVGSERDVGSPSGGSSNSILESYDNIHNHDLTR